MTSPLFRYLFTVILMFCAVFCIGQNKDVLKPGPAAFTKNKGQIVDHTGKPNSEVLYLLNTPGLNVQLRKSGFSYDVYEREKQPVEEKSINEHFHKKEIFKDAAKRVKTSFHRIDIDFVNSNPNAEIREIGETDSYTNYYNVPGREEGITKVKTYKSILYKDLYPNIDLEFFIPEDPSKPVEYNFVIHSKGNIQDIKMKFSGAEVNCSTGSLELNLKHGIMKEIIPASWSGEGERKKPVLIEYMHFEQNIFGFNYADGSKKAKNAPLTIDPTPVRQWATYFGGEENESYFVGDVATDSRGNSIISGYTQSLSIIGTGGPPESYYEGQAFTFIAKFDPAGNLLWTTYNGGALGALFRSITVDKDDNIIAVGDSASQDNIATPGTHQTELYPGNNENYPDAIIVKFDLNGNRIWGTYFGGESFDALTGVTTDKQGNIYTIGTTASHENISTPGSFKEIGDADVHHKWNGILARFDKDGNRVWATYYGGEHTSEIAIDNEGNIYFVGDTYSHDEIATPGAYRENFLGTTWNEAFIAKFTPGGDRIWGTYFGGYDYDFGEGLAIDSKNNVIISGATRSDSDIATPGAHKETKATVTDWDAFLAKFDSAGNIIWSTFYGGDEGESFYYNKVDVDNNDNIYLFGNTGSENGISTPDGYQTVKSGDADVFLAKFNPIGERIWGTYYGGNSSDFAVDLDVNAQGEIFLIGWTYSKSGISTPGAHQTAYGGKIDAFLVKFKDCNSSFVADVPEGICEGENLRLSASGANTYLWTGPNGFTSTQANPVIPNATAAHSGTYFVTLISGDGCDDTRDFQVVVSPAPVAHPVPNLISCEAEYNTGISAGFDFLNLASEVLGNQTGMTVFVYDGNGNQLSAPLPSEYINTIPWRETLTIRVFNENNPECYAETSFDIIVKPVPEILPVENIGVCDIDSDGIAEINLNMLTQSLAGNNSNLSIEYFDQNQAPVILSQTGNFKNSTPFRETLTARVTYNDSGCYSETNFDIIIGPAPVAHPIDDLIGCDDDGDGISEYFDVSQVEANVLQGQTGLEVSYFGSDGGELTNFTSPYINREAFEETITVKLTNPETGCFAETSLLLKTSKAPQVNIPATQYACDEGNGFGSFDTSEWVQQVIGNQTGLNISWFDDNGNVLPTPLPAIYRNSVSGTQTLTAIVEDENNSLCSSETKLHLVVNKKISLDLQDSYSLCGLEPFLELELYQNFDTWEWSSENGSILSTTSKVTLHEDGMYSLRVGTYENGILCEETRSFQLLRSVLPVIREINMRDWSSRNYIEIIADGDGDFEYSIDGVNFTEANYFENLQGGIYTVYVRDKNGCGMDTREVLLLDYPKFFTPNNDGHNDHWQLSGLPKESETFIHIFDRYGKLLKQLSSHSGGWDGTFNGKQMPADDYWFKVNLDDGREFTGHFSLVLK